VLRVDEHPQPRAEQRLIVDEGDADGAHVPTVSRVNGIVARTRNRPLVPSLASSSPPASVARSRMPGMPWPAEFAGMVAPAGSPLVTITARLAVPQSKTRSTGA